MQTSTNSTSPSPAPSPALVWTGRVISALPVLGLLMSAAMKFTNAKELTEGMAKLGWPANLAVPLGVTELICTVLYIIPQTSVLGAILLTGYLGGATATHVRIGDNFMAPIIMGFMAPIIMGVLVWLSLFLRDPRLRALLPLRR